MLLNRVRDSVLRASKSRYWKSLNRIAPLLVIILLVTIFFWKFFILGEIPIPGDFLIGTYYPWLDYKWGYAVGVPVKNPITTDVVSFSYPMRLLAINLIKDLQLPIWNPYILSGTPLLANFQSAPFTFTNIVYFIFANLNAWGMQVVLQHFFVLLFTYLLLRHWKIGRLAAVFGAIIFAFSGFNIIWSEWNSHTLASSFIPLLVLFVDKYLTTSNKKYLLGLSIGVCFQIFAGYPQVTLYTLLALFVLWLTRINCGQIFSKTVYLAVFGLLGFGLAAVQLLPGVELLNLSQRSVELNPYDWAFLPLQKLITFIAPDYFGNHATGNYWGPQDYTSNVGYVGMVAMVLSTIGLASMKKSDKPLYYVFWLSLVTLAFSLSTPVSEWIWNSGFLGLKAASAHRGLVLWNFSVAIAAAYGLDRLVRIKLGLKQLFGTFIIIIIYLSYLAVSVYLFSFNSNQDVLTVKHLSIGIRNLAIPGIVLFVSVLLVLAYKINVSKKLLSILIVTLTVCELFRFGWKYTPFTKKELVYPSTAITDYLKNLETPSRITGLRVIPMNMRMAYGLESPEGYDAVYTQRMAQFLATMGSSNSNATTAGRYGFVDNEDSHLLDLINTKYYLAHKVDAQKKPMSSGTVPLELQKGKKIIFESGSVAVLQKNSALERAFMVYQWETVKDKKQILDKLIAPGFPISSKIILEESVEGIQTTDEIKHEVKYLEYKETTSTLSVFTEKDGLLFVSDAFYPGWNVFVDGKKSKIFMADYTFRGVKVPKGEHIVKFEYKPQSFINGLKISLFSFCLLLLYTYTIKSKPSNEKKIIN